MVCSELQSPRLQRHPTGSFAARCCHWFWYHITISKSSPIRQSWAQSRCVKDVHVWRTVGSMSVHVYTCLPMLHHMIWWASQRFHISFSNLAVETPALRVIVSPLGFCIYIFFSYFLCNTTPLDQSSSLLLTSGGGKTPAATAHALKTAMRKFRNLRWFIALIYWSSSQEETMGHAVKNNSWFIMHDDSVIQFNLGTNWAITMTSTHTCGWGALAEGDKPYLYKDVAMPRKQNKIQSPKVPEGYSLCDVPAPRSARSQPNDVFSTGFRDLVCSCLPMLHHMIWWASQRFHISFSNLVVETPEYVPMFLEWDLIQQTCSPHNLCMPPFPGPNISVACIQGKPELGDTKCRFVWIYLCVVCTQGISPGVLAFQASSMSECWTSSQV